MVKLSNEIRNEILEKFKNKVSTGSIINEYKLSRSTVQRLRNELPLLNQDDNISYASSSKEELNNLLNDLNNETPTIEPQIIEPIKMNDQMTDQMNNRIVQDEVIRVQEPVQNSTFSNIHGKMDIINKLDLFNEKVSHKPVQNQNQPVQQPPRGQNITVNATDKNYIEKKNLISKVKRFIQSFPIELNNITGGNSQLFIHRLLELECHQLEQLIINIQFEINQPRVSQLFNTIFFTTLNQVENLSNSFGYDVNGMTANLQKNEECLNALKELNCIYDISGVSTPQMRLLMTVMMTGMNCYNTNKISQTIDNHLETPISQDIQEQFKNL
jgi:hypothetical protein